MSVLIPIAVDELEAEAVEFEVIEAVTFDGAVWCVACLPEDVDLFQEDVFPIFSACEWGVAYPLCLKCGHEHRHVRLMGGR